MATRIAFVGDTSGPLARSLDGIVDLVAFSDAASRPDAPVLVDSAVPDQAFLASILAEGRTVAIATPDDDARTSLLSVTGQAAAGPVALVTARAVSPGAGFVCTTAPDSATIATAVVDELGAHAEPPRDVRSAPVGAALLRAIASHDTPGMGDWSIPGFVPHAQSRAGYTQVLTQMDWQVPFPAFDGQPDDTVTGATPQSISSDISTEFFVYWVNGKGPPSPYFEVIVRQTGPAAIGLSHSRPETRGWFNASFGVGPCSFTDAQDHPFADGVAGLSSYTPTTENDGGLALNLTEITLALYGRTTGGVGTYLFSPTLQRTQPFGGWAVQDQTSAQTPRWLFAEAQGWDPTQIPPSSSELLTALYAEDGTVIALPAESFGSLSFETLSAWQIQPPQSGPPPPQTAPAPSFPVTFRSAASQLVALAHNPRGCKGAAGGQRRHVFSSTREQAAPDAWRIDLGMAANLMNYPPQQ